MSREMLKLIFEASGKSTKQIADAINVHVGCVSKWTAGTAKPGPQSQERIRKEFKSEIAKLYK